MVWYYSIHLTYSHCSQYNLYTLVHCLLRNVEFLNTRFQPILVLAFSVFGRAISAESEGDAKGDGGFAVSRMGNVKRYLLTVPDTTFAKRFGEYRNYLQRQGYKPSHIDKGFQGAALTNRNDLLKPKFKPFEKKYPLVLDFNPHLPDFSKILKKHIHLISDSPALRIIFPKRSIFSAFRRTKNGT